MRGGAGHVEVRQVKGPCGQNGRDDEVNQTKIKIRGLTPLLMHSGRLADPIDPATLALARLTGKRKKTVEDHHAIGKCEWTGGLYVNDKGAPCLPGEVIEACLVEGAKKSRRGKDAKSGIVVVGDFALEYDGPKTIEKLWEHGGFRKRAAVRVGQAKVMRTRPIFPEWSCTFTVQWDPAVIKDAESILEIAEAAGQAGIGDWRPKFGRFEVVTSS